MEYRGRRVTIMGLGRFGGGVAAARWLARQGARVTVTDLADQETLADSLDALRDEPIAEFHLDGHREEDFRQAELIVVNPAVRPENRLLQLARQSGAQLTSEIELFMRASPAPIIGVTGSNGKSTTAAMTAVILRAAGRRAWLGGNIGHSLLDDLPNITADDRAVLELSSFQLEHLSDHTPSVNMALVTGCCPNHLDWHKTFEAYIAAKQKLLTGQTNADMAVLNTHDPQVARWTSLVRGKLLPLKPVDSLPTLSVPGEHNRLNATLAATACRALGCDDAAVRQGLESFQPLPQRLEWLAVVEGRRFYNDSTATTPESTIAALQSIEEPVWLLAGGREKGCDFSELTDAIAQRAQGAAFFGSTAQTLHDMTQKRRPQLRIVATDNLAEALAWCWERSRPGHAIVLSPACASSDQFRDFRHRGETFAELVRILADPRNR